VNGYGTSLPSEQLSAPQTESSTTSKSSSVPSDGTQQDKNLTDDEADTTQDLLDQPTGSSKTSVADLSIRVNVNVLDSLMNLVGELVLTRNQLLQLSRGDDESKYAAPITHLNRVTTDLQEGVMKTRMQPDRQCVEQVTSTCS
jgi:two-component system chemotaxis sensor kinase CheA